MKRHIKTTIALIFIILFIAIGLEACHRFSKQDYFDSCLILFLIVIAVFLIYFLITLSYKFLYTLFKD